MTSGLLISAAHFKKLPAQVQTLILSVVIGEDIPDAPYSSAADERPSTPIIALLDDEHFAELSPGQAKMLIAGCQPKTRKALETIAASDSPNFHIADVAKALGVKPGDLSGVWSGLTRRVRKVTDDSDAYLIDWTKNAPIDDADGNYVDQIGEISDLTYHSLRKALGM